MKRLLGPVIDVAYLIGMIDLVGARRVRGRVPILMYHRVLPDPSPDTSGRDPFDTMEAEYAAPTVSRFEAQIKWIVKRFHLLTLDQLAAVTAGEKRPPRRAMVITFDDGFADTFTLAGPVIEKYGARAVVLLTHEAVDRGRPILIDELTWILRRQRAAPAVTGLPSSVAELFGAADWSDPGDVQRAAHDATWLLKDLGPEATEEVLGILRPLAPDGAEHFRSLYLTWDQARDLAERGWEIGSHGLAHPSLPQCSERTLEEEIRGSKALIEERIGRRVTSFCYPYGDFDPRAVETVARAGYTLGFSTIKGVSAPLEDPLALRRVGMGGDRLSFFAAKAYGLH